MKDARVVLDAGRNASRCATSAPACGPRRRSCAACSAPAFDLLEQNFDFDLLTPAKLLEKYAAARYA